MVLGNSIFSRLVLIAIRYNMQTGSLHVITGSYIVLLNDV